MGKVKRVTKKKTVKKSVKPAKSAKSVKTAVKKTSASKNKAAFLKEVSKLIEQVDDKDLADLLKNFTTTVKNLKVLNSYNKNKEIREAHNKRIDEMYSGKSIIEISEGPDNLYFILKINGKVKSFTLEEMRKLVKISHSASNAQECSSMFFNWFSKFRFDFLNDLDITNKNSRIFADLQEFLKGKYAVKN